MKINKKNITSSNAISVNSVPDNCQNDNGTNLHTSSTGYTPIDTVDEIKKQLSLGMPDSLVPVDGNKRPYQKDWQKTQYTLEQITQELESGRAFGYGLKPNGEYILIDCDGMNVEAFINFHLSWLTTTHTPRWTSQKEGRYQLILGLTENQKTELRKRNFSTKKKEITKGEYLELRFDNCQSVMPPSVHPETGQYVWKGDFSVGVHTISDSEFQALCNIFFEESRDFACEVSTQENPRHLTSDGYVPPCEAIPLETCIAPKHRELISNGENQGNRDNAGAALARDLIGTASYLDGINQCYEGNPRQLLLDYCARCSPPLSQRDCHRIYESAKKAHPSPCLDEEKIKGCIKAFLLRERKYTVEENKPNMGQNNMESGSNYSNQLPVQEAVNQAKKIFLADYDEITQNILLEDVRKRANIAPRTWEDKFIRPLKRELRTEKLKLELKAYLQEPDPFVQVLKKQQICSNYSLAKDDFKLLVQQLEIQQSTPKQTVFTFEEFFNLESEGLTWLVPGILPRQEMLLVAALAKTGKSLLATDIAYAVLTGTSVIGEKAHQGKVLYISSDESPNSLKRRFYARGFDLLPSDVLQNLRVMTHLDLNNLSILESQLEEFRPDLVIIDSLTSITLDLGISEKDSEFARYIYKLKDLLNRYGAASILTHHENKDKDAKGINKVSGSARIPAAVWGIAQMVAAEPHNDLDQQRWLSIKPREGEPVKHCLEINHKELWASSGILKHKGEFGDERGEKKTQAEMVLELLRQHSPSGLESREINEVLALGHTLYSVLARLEDRQLITKRRSQSDGRRWVYAVPLAPDHVELNSQQAGEDLSSKVDSTALPPPPP